MKRLKAGSVNSISFIRNISYTINSFDVTFEKVVGGTVLTLFELQDELGLAVCSDFIVLNLDLVSNTIEGGEYYMTVTNAGGSTTYLCEVQSYQYNTHGTDIYADSVVLSGDVTGSVAVENTDAVTPEQGGTTSGGSTSTDTSTDTSTGTSGGGSLPWGDIGVVFNNGYIDGSSDPFYIVDVEQDLVSFRIKDIPQVNGKDYSLNITFTDSDNNTFTVVKTHGTISSTNSRTSTIQNLSTRGLNYGDVWDVEVVVTQGGNTYSTFNFNVLMPPSIDLYMADSLTNATAYRSTETDTTARIDLYNDTLIGSPNLYAYVNENTQCTMQLLSNDSHKSFVNYSTFSESFTQNIVSESFTAPVGQMTEIKNAYPFKTLDDSAFSHSTVNVVCSWVVDGQTISEDVSLWTAPDGSLSYYQTDATINRTFTLRHRSEHTITLNGNDYVIESEVPVVLNRPNDPTNKVAYNTIYTPPLYELYLGFVGIPNVFDPATSTFSGGQITSPIASYFDDQQSGVAGNVKVLTRETYTDGTVIEVENKSLFFAAGVSGTRQYYNNIQSGIDPIARVSFSQEDTTKTLDNMIVWFGFNEYGTNNTYYYDVDNGSANSPEFYFEP